MKTEVKTLNDMEYTIFVVDDEKSLVRLIRKTLERSGFHTEGISNGSDAIAYAGEHPDTLMLVDYAMPRMNGKQLIEKLIQKGCNVPFIIMTGHGDQGIAVEMMKLGARDYIVKDTGFVNVLPQVIKKVTEELVQEKKLAMAETELHKYQNKLKSLVTQLSLTEEFERKRIAGALHNNIAQFLALTKIKLGLLEKKLHTDNLTKNIKEIRTYIEKSIQVTRSLISELNPPVLSNLSFKMSLEWLLTEFQKNHGWQVSFKNDDSPKQLNESSKTILFTAVRELFFNIVKHAHAKNITLSLNNIDGNIQILVTDDGVGFDASKKLSYSSQDNGFGLFNISEKLDYIGGKFEIISEHGKGTRAILTAPLEKE